MPAPTDVTNLMAWLDATQGRYDATSGGSSVTSDRGQIAGWEVRDGTFSGQRFTQGTSARRCVYDATRGLVVSETNLGATQWFDCPASFTLDRRNFSIFFVCEPSSYYASALGLGHYDNHFMAGSSGDSLNLYWQKTGRLFYYDGAEKGGDVTVTVPGNRCLLGWVGKAGSFDFWVNGTKYSGTVASSGNSTLNAIMGYASTGVGQSQVGCKDVMVYSRSLTDSEITDTIYAYAQSRGVTVPSGRRLFFIGDSITHGYGVTVNRTLAQRTNLSADVFLYVMCRSGATLADLNTDGFTNNCLSPLLQTNDVCVVFAGTNDLAAAVGAATTEARLNTLCTNIQATGAKVLVVTAISRTAQDGNISDYNALVKANYTGYADGIVEADEHVAFDSGSSGDTTYYLADAIHPNDTGTQILADLIRPAARELLGIIDIEGTCGVSFGAGSTTLSGTGTLSGSSANVFSVGSTLLTGTGTLLGSCTLLFGAGSSNLGGTGSLAGNCSVIFTLQGSTLGGGSISGNCVIVFGGTDTLTGGGSLVGICSLTSLLSGSLTGSGILAGSVVLVFDAQGSGDVSSNTLAGSTSLGFTTAATLVGYGALSGVCTVEFTASGTTDIEGAVLGPYTVDAIDTYVAGVREIETYTSGMVELMTVSL